MLSSNKINPLYTEVPKEQRFKFQHNYTLIKIIVCVVFIFFLPTKMDKCSPKLVFLKYNVTSVTRRTWMQERAKRARDLGHPDSDRLG